MPRPIAGILRLVALAAWALTAPAWAADDPEARFAEDAAQHSRDLRDLYSKRGLAAPKMSDATVDDVARFLTEQRADESPGYAPGTAVLFYAFHKGTLSAYLIDTSGLVAHHSRAVAKEELESAIRDFRRSLKVDGIDRSRAPRWRGNPRLVEKPGKPKRGAAGRLNDLLLPDPIREPLADVRQLIVVANGAIATNPFAMLKLDKEDMLIDRMNVSVSAGLFDLDQMIEPWWGKRDFRNALIVGDPPVPEDADWLVPRLPGAAEEASHLAEMIAGEALIGASATKAEVSARAPRASVLYFAAHGVSNPEEPLTGGFLMLSGPDPANAFWSAKELQSRRLRAGLAVLSACQSGLGLNHDGGVIGLSRSFQKAGVPRVVMSLWSVSDEATLFLMERFHGYVMEEIPAEALRLAMLDTRKVYPEPALWAPFTLFGTPR